MNENTIIKYDYMLDARRILYGVNLGTAGLTGWGTGWVGLVGGVVRGWGAKGSLLVLITCAARVIYYGLIALT
jgi:hypothetical protein